MEILVIGMILLIGVVIAGAVVGCCKTISNDDDEGGAE